MPPLHAVVTVWYCRLYLRTFWQSTENLPLSMERKENSALTEAAQASV